ncbi:MAG: hydrogenase nickel incorporation protein HypB [Deltaproteobacteria bacterium]|nr:hydrogenase nickel incorporation protein HypB [Deltaproteobacteria bacterium]
MCESCGCGIDHERQTTRTIDVYESLLAANTKQAGENRRSFETLGAVAVNMISGPGAGKTTLLEHTIEHLGNELRLGVIEGDIETERDAARIRKKGAPVVQITTGGACHLDARLVHKGLHRLRHESGMDRFDLIFIENVGNLVCPATFDLGEHQRVVLVSVPEGSDKPAKYPKAFLSSQRFLITKTDLLPHFDFSIDEARREALKLNPAIRITELSATAGGQGFEDWLLYLRQLLRTAAAA